MRMERRTDRHTDVTKLMAALRIAKAYKNLFLLVRDVNAVCSGINANHINTLCEQAIKLLNVKHGGT
jgi:hypothetical protein